jgi:UDP-glucose 4-epimerase
MRILITGGAGFIGSKLARRIIADGGQVVIVDNLSTGVRDNIPAEAEFIEADVGRPETIGRLPLTPFDAVCHLAAQSSGAVSMEQPFYDFQTNATSTLLLTRWCLKNGTRRFVYASSMAVYGNPATLPVGELDSLNPISYYGVSKLASERLMAVAAAQGLRCTALRMFNVYGPGQNMANLRQGMASIYLAYLLRGEEVPVTGSLERFRDFVFIDDVIDAWMRVLSLESTPAPVYNIASGEATRVQDLLGYLISACGLPPDHPVRSLPAPPGDQFGLRANVSQALEDLGWRPGIGLPEGLRRFVSWARASGG